MNARNDEKAKKKKRKTDKGIDLVFFVQQNHEIGKMQSNWEEFFFRLLLTVQFVA